MPVVLVCGCQRGWLMDWLTSHGAGEDQAKSSPAGSFRLHQVDCPAGLARCVEGAVEVAQPFRHPEPCQGGKEQCECPWTVVGRCPTGCVAGGVSLGLPVERALRQLCKPGVDEGPVANPPPLGSPPPVACEDMPYRCSQGSVIACPAQRIVASCNRGCANDGEGLDEPAVDDAAAVFLLCSR